MPTPLYALLVGINTYKAAMIPTLRGCRNDVELLASVLRKQFELDEAHLRLLTDEEATHDGIKQAIREHLIDTARDAKAAGQPMPAFLFHFSGHGSLARDASGLKATGFDETIVPHDSRQAGVFDIKDWELGALFDELATYTSNITVVLDCCHSGSGTRDAELPTRQCLPDMRPQPERPAAIASGMRSVITGDEKNLNTHVLLAACSHSQSANEYLDTASPEKRVYGALSFALSQELSQSLSTQPTYHELYQRVCRRLHQWYPLQSPQCEGDRDRELFGGVRPKQELWISVTGGQDGLVRIDAGRVQGLADGVELHVYPESQRTVAADDRPLARLRITQCDAVFSLCDVMDGDAVPPPGSRVQPTLCSPQLTQWVSLASANDATRAACLARFAEPDLRGLIAPTMEKQADLLVISERDGDTLCDAAGQPLENPEQTRTLDSLMAAIRKWARHLNALRIENMSPQSELRGAVSVELKRKDGTTIPEATLPVLESGTIVQVQITNRSTTPLYVSALSFGYDGSVSLIWPAMTGEKIPLPPGKAVTTRAFRLAFQPGETRLQVREAIKVFATRSPTDFDLLTMDAAGNHAATRMAATPSTGPLGRLLEQAARGSGLRILQPVESAPEEDWTTVELHYRLTRPLKELHCEIASGRPQPLPGTACVVTAPAGFTGTLRVDNPETGTRTTAMMQEQVASASVLPGILGNNATLIQSLQIEADDLSRSQLSAATPLRMEWTTGQRHVSADDDYQLVAIASDGELHYPVGGSDVDGSVAIHWLPPAITTVAEGIGTRSVVGAIRLYIYKMLKWDTGSLGLQLLQWVPTEDVAMIPPELGERTRLFATGQVRKRRALPHDIHPEHRILLLVHGSLADGDTMLAEVAPLVTKAGQTYDRTLAFEYETVGTPLLESATQLTRLLTTLGVGATESRRVDVMAVGSGCLVARAAIELLGAHARVHRCLLAGPPNTGTMLAQSQKLASWLGTLALAKSALVPYLLPLNLAFNKAVNDAAAVRDLQPNSEFLQSLNASSPPQQPAYTILSGVAQLPPAMAGFVRRLADATLALFLDDEHDLVCSQKSMCTVREGTFPADKLQVQIVPADHFTYWSEPQSADRVVAWLKESEA